MFVAPGQQHDHEPKDVTFTLRRTERTAGVQVVSSDISSETNIEVQDRMDSHEKENDKMSKHEPGNPYRCSHTAFPHHIRANGISRNLAALFLLVEVGRVDRAEGCHFMISSSSI